MRTMLMPLFFLMDMLNVGNFRMWWGEDSPNLSSCRWMKLMRRWMSKRWFYKWEPQKIGSHLNCRLLMRRGSWGASLWNYLSQKPPSLSLLQDQPPRRRQGDQITDVESRSLESICSITGRRNAKTVDSLAGYRSRWTGAFIKSFTFYTAKKFF